MSVPLQQLTSCLRIVRLFNCQYVRRFQYRLQNRGPMVVTRQAISSCCLTDDRARSVPLALRHIVAAAIFTWQKSILQEPIVSLCSLEQSSSKGPIASICYDWFFRNGWKKDDQTWGRGVNERAQGSLFEKNRMILLSGRTHGEDGHGIAYSSTNEKGRGTAGW